MSGPNESSGILRAMEGLKIINEVECKMACSSSKVRTCYLNHFDIFFCILM